MQQRAASQCNKGPFHNPTKGHTRLFPNAEKSFISEKVVNVSLKSVRMLPATKKHGRQKNSGRNKTLPVEVFSRLSLPAYCMSPSCRKTREPPIYPTDASLPASLPEGPDAAIPWCSRGHPPHRRRERHARSRAAARVTQQQQIAPHLGRDQLLDRCSTDQGTAWTRAFCSVRGQLCPATARCRRGTPAAPAPAASLPGAGYLCEN